MKCPKCGHDFPNPEKIKGGKTSKRKITPAEQKKMQDARKKKKEDKPI